MKFFRPLALLLSLASLTALRAQPLINDAPVDQHVRLSWLFDDDGARDGGELNGVEIGYGSRIYPFDQMIVSYSHFSEKSYDYNAFLLSFEQFFPLSEMLVPYGVFGVGYAFADQDGGASPDQRGGFLKIGGGLMLHLFGFASLFGEGSYLVADKPLWQDNGNNLDSQNVIVQLGVRFQF